jgi:hypothetical protein
MFIAEILDEQQLKVEKMFVDDAVISEFHALQFGKQVIPQIEEIEKEFIAGLRDKFVMNVTALNNYLKCPLEFYFKNLIRILHRKMRPLSLDHLSIMQWSSCSEKCRATMNVSLPGMNS